MAAASPTVNIPPVHPLVPNVDYNIVCAAEKNLIFREARGTFRIETDPKSRFPDSRDWGKTVQMKIEKSSGFTYEYMYRDGVPVESPRD